MDWSTGKVSVDDIEEIIKSLCNITKGIPRNIDGNTWSRYVLQMCLDSATTLNDLEGYATLKGITPEEFAKIKSSILKKTAQYTLEIIAESSAPFAKERR